MARIDGYHMMIVSKYFNSFEDFVKVEMLNKKYFKNTEKFHSNPISLTNKNLKYFPNVETLNLYNETDDDFGYEVLTSNTTYPQNIKKLFFKVNVWYEVSYKKYTESSEVFLDKVSFKNLVLVNFNDLNSEVISPNIRVIGERCFKNAPITDVVIPPTVIKIKDNAFENSTRLRHISFPQTVWNIPQSMCYNCNLHLLTLPFGVTKISSFAFMNNNIRIITLPESLEIIEDMAFANNEILRDITIPKSVKVLKENAFYKCKELIKIKVFSIDIIENNYGILDIIKKEIYQ
ncbi:hypothetical protein EIN_217960 [Entamoeba invadens IP1]|uniref:Leucine rich repeat containing protein BspA family protein n=1 Tax=Entamoeba invadens IP1 TaxID=370355 RepID=L7FPN9_ENTIV|nr:hypothetical protein EIN_217960 [Entamoeba invadens IP1]ELP95331.1 hypothetical protein EIN_217960 [Entamoeba invadens IP1]|eukprot:XP_004262102.1 hypothetical protein EIN_217960 [Entamoeba invadens IP1]